MSPIASLAPSGISWSVSPIASPAASSGTTEKVSPTGLTTPADVPLRAPPTQSAIELSSGPVVPSNTSVTNAPRSVDCCNRTNDPQRTDHARSCLSSRVSVRIPACTSSGDRSHACASFSGRTRSLAWLSSAISRSPIRRRPVGVDGGARVAEAQTTVAVLVVQ